MAKQVAKLVVQLQPEMPAVSRQELGRWPPAQTTSQVPPPPLPPPTRGLWLCGGGTGGHVFPGLAVAAAWREVSDEPLVWYGDRDRIEARLVPAADIPLHASLSRPRITRPRWLLQSLWRGLRCGSHLLRQRPRAVVALGGYAALMPGLLAWLCGRPLIVLEQNARAGRTNRLLARRASAVITQFAEAAHDLPWRRVYRLGNPVRALQRLPRGGGKRLNLLVMGGSLSAQSLNNLIVNAAADLATIDQLHVIHLAGQEDVERCEAAYQAAGLSAEVMGFCDDMPALYQRVDLMLGRAGATTVAECCAAGLGALYIPLPWAAEDHQTANARAVARIGGAVVLPQDSIQPSGLAALIARLAEHRREVARLGERAATSLAQPHAARDVVQLILQGLFTRNTSTRNTSTRTPETFTHERN